MARLCCSFFLAVATAQSADTGACDVAEAATACIETREAAEGVALSLELLQKQIQPHTLHQLQHRSLHSAHSVKSASASQLLWDEDLLARSCLPEWMEETGTSIETVCSDDPNNNIKDDKSNYIQFTRREDRLMYEIWSHALEDCSHGEPYVRDIVDSFSRRTSCFSTSNESEMQDEAWMYIPVKVLNDEEQIVVTEDKDKVLCPGDKKTPNQTVLFEQMSSIQELVKQWDSRDENTNTTAVCQKMLAAHTLDEFGFIGVLHSTRPAACNAKAEYYDASLCEAAETYLRDFQSRDLFANDGDGFKGRAAEGENERAEKCKETVLQGDEWYDHKVMHPGITRADNPKCTIETGLEVFPEPILKVGIYHENQADNLVARAYRQCGAPFVAGISATMPQYLASVAAGPSKNGMTFEKAATMKEVMTLMSMLELGGFHATTGLSLSVNYYKKELIVTPPFDSGSFDEEGNDGFIRCHDTETNCCTNETKIYPEALFVESDGFYNHEAYSNMMSEWEALVRKTWPKIHGSSLTFP